MAMGTIGIQVRTRTPGNIFSAGGQGKTGAIRIHRWFHIKKPQSKEPVDLVFHAIVVIVVAIHLPGARAQLFRCSGITVTTQTLVCIGDAVSNLPGFTFRIQPAWKQD